MNVKQLSWVDKIRTVMYLGEYELIILAILLIGVCLASVLYYSCDLEISSKHNPVFEGGRVYKEAALASTSQFFEEYVLWVFLYVDWGQWWPCFFQWSLSQRWNCSGRRYYSIVHSRTHQSTKLGYWWWLSLAILWSQTHKYACLECSRVLTIRYDKRYVQKLPMWVNHKFIFYFFLGKIFLYVEKCFLSAFCLL